MNEGLLSKYRIISIASSGFLILWYFFDANISKINFLKDLGLQNQQIISYILVVIITFCIVESLIEYTKNQNKSWQSNAQLLIIIIIPILSLTISYPKLIENTFLKSTDRLDLLIPILTSFFSSIVALALCFEINFFIVFYKLRKTVLPIHIIFFVLYSVLLILGIAAISLFNGKNAVNEFPLRYFIYGISFLISFISLSPKEKIFSENQLDWLEKKSASLDRAVEVSEYVSSLRKPLSHLKKKGHKKIMKTIRMGDTEQRKANFLRFITIEEISFKETGDHVTPIAKGVKDDDPVIKVNTVNKNTGEIIESVDVKFKYVKMACEQPSKLIYGNDIKGFLNPIAARAHSIHLFHESNPNDLMLDFAHVGDEVLNNLKELVKARNPDINYHNPDGWTALLLAVANGEEKTADYLLNKAADPNIATKHGATPLHFASKYGNYYLCKLLLNYHADANKRDIDGKTPLMLAAMFGHNAIIKLLIQYGADVRLVDNQEKSALTYATEGKYGTICKQLREENKEKSKSPTIQ